MAYFINGYPYSDTHNLNLDWVIDTLKRIATEVGELHYGLEIHVTDTDGTEIYTFTVKDNGIYITRPDGGTPFFYNFNTQTLHAPYFDGQSFLFATGRTTGQMRAGSLVLDNALQIEQGGTGSTSAADARDALGAVSKAGDIMTGILAIPSGSVYGSGGSYATLFFKNGVDAQTNIGYIGMNRSTRKLLLACYAPGNNAEIYYGLPTPAENETNGGYDILTSKTPVTVAQGGTGDTAPVSGTISSTASTLTLSEARLRRWGRVVTASGSFTSTAAINSYATLFTLPEGFRSSIGTLINTRIFNDSTGAMLPAYIENSGAFITRTGIYANTKYWFEFSFVM